MRRRPATCLAAALTGAAACLAACSPSSGDGANATPQASDAPDPAIAERSLPGRTTMLAMACTGCHSEVGEGIVSLDTYSSEQLVTSLTAYRTDADGTTVMHRLMRGYSEEDIEAVSAYIAEGGAP